MKATITLLPAIAACALFSSCADYATIKERRPAFHPLGTMVGAFQKRIEDANQRSQHDPMSALADYLAAAKEASDQLERTPNDAAVRDSYNYAVARILSTIQSSKLDPWSKPLTVPAKEGDFVLTHRPDKRKAWNPALYDFKPADQFDVGGVFIKKRQTKDGIGAPTVAIGREMNENPKENFTLPRTYYGVTTVARFNGRRCELAFEDPLATETVRLDGHSYPLAADFTVPIAVMLASTDVHEMELARLLNPEKYAHTARIARLQPYDPDKTVVLVIHGLDSSPATWTPMINELRSNAEIRRHFQFWFYSYPSGYPYPHSAAILRNDLDEIERKFPLHKKMVVVGHSMGGCISRLLITDVGDKLWKSYFGKPPAEVDMSPESKKLLTDALIFKPRPEIGRVIMIAAPLKGADMAAGWVGQIGAMLVRSPLTLVRAGTEVMKTMTFQGDGMTLKRLPNSVDTMSSKNRFVKTINTFPPSATIPYHSIMGDRGKGGNKDHTDPVCSDGLVAYWSSHLDGAKSELLVPSGHNAHQNSEAIDEVKRILLLHAKESGGR